MQAIPPSGDQMNEIQTLPVLPLREAVILPGVTMPIVAGRPVVRDGRFAAEPRVDEMLAEHRRLARRIQLMD